MSWAQFNPATGSVTERGGVIEIDGKAALFVQRCASTGMNPVQKDTLQRQIAAAIRAGIIVVPTDNEHDTRIRATTEQRMQRLAKLERQDSELTELAGVLTGVTA